MKVRRGVSKEGKIIGVGNGRKLESGREGRASERRKCAEEGGEEDVEEGRAESASLDDTSGDVEGGCKVAVGADAGGETGEDALDCIPEATFDAGGPQAIPKDGTANPVEGFLNVKKGTVDGFRGWVVVLGGKDGFPERGKSVTAAFTGAKPEGVGREAKIVVGVLGNFGDAGEEEALVELKDEREEGDRAVIVGVVGVACGVFNDWKDGEGFEVGEVVAVGEGSVVKSD